MEVLVIGGATASGKTELAVSLAEKYNGEVVSADALLVYRKLNIGTAKPSEEEKRGIVHHMIDVVSPTESFSVSDYERTALPIVRDILSRGKTPVICGGTGFYIKSLLFFSQFGNTPASPALREKYEGIAKEHGKHYLHSLLAAVDPESAEKLHENDQKRVIRALEIYDLTGKKKSEQNDREESRFSYRAYAIDWQRDVLYDRIERRTEQMFKDGLVEEVKSLFSEGVTPEMQCMQAIGYKEVCEGLKNNVSLAEMKEEIQKNTRNYAKRQLTFFKKFPRMQWVGKEEIDRL